MVLLLLAHVVDYSSWVDDLFFGSLKIGKYPTNSNISINNSQKNIKTTFLFQWIIQ